MPRDRIIKATWNSELSNRVWAAGTWRPKVRGPGGATTTRTVGPEPVPKFFQKRRCVHAPDMRGVLEFGWDVHILYMFQVSCKAIQNVTERIVNGESFSRHGHKRRQPGPGSRIPKWECFRNSLGSLMETRLECEEIAVLLTVDQRVLRRLLENLCDANYLPRSTWPQ